jgi:hypothetical protein
MYSRVQRGLWLSLHAKVCSLPPDPNKRICIKRLIDYGSNRYATKQPVSTGSGEDTGGLPKAALFYDEWRKSSIKINPYFGRPFINDCAEK